MFNTTVDNLSDDQAARFEQVCQDLELEGIPQENIVEIALTSFGDYIFGV